MYRICLSRRGNFGEWRDAARRLLQAGIAPHEVDWCLESEGGLFAAPDRALPGAKPAVPRAVVPASFPELAEAIVCHSDPGSFALLYRLLHRLQGERHLLSVASDADVVQAGRLAKSVRRDCHKMTAFVRFRELAHPGKLRVSDEPAAKPDLADPADALWLTYYASIFNPARVKVKAMQAEMPKKYWKNLPEAALIPELVASAQARVADMARQEALAPPAFHARVQSLHEARQAATPATPLAVLRQQASACTRCPLHCHATQTVFGEGPEAADLMFVGEQPGDREDLAGRPFVGPAGQLFDRTLGEVGIDRGRAYVTNAVKHFKFEPRGKRRIHRTPNAGEVERCRWWLEQEIEAVKPRLVVAMGATALGALTGRKQRLGDVRGRLLPFGGGRSLFVTVHPSYLLRIPDPVRAAGEMTQFRNDLATIASKTTG
jgi:DNA polymerase